MISRFVRSLLRSIIPCVMYMIISCESRVVIGYL